MKQHTHIDKTFLMPVWTKSILAKATTTNRLNYVDIV